MTRTRSLLAASMALIFALSLTLSPAVPAWSQTAPKVVGVAATVVNDVRIKPAAVKQFAKAKLRQRVAIADQLRTGTDSRLQIALLDKTKVSMGANAQLTIDKFVYDPEGGSLTLSAAKGALRFLSGPAKSNRRVNTPSASIGIRGTVFDAAVGELAVEIARRERSIPPDTAHDPETATLAVLRGPGPNRQGQLSQGAIDVEAAGQTVALEKPLLAAYVPFAGAPPIGPFTISLPGLAMLNDIILPPPPRREFEPATAGYPVPRRERREPPYPGGAYPGAYPVMPDTGTDAGVPGFPTLPQDGMPQSVPTRPMGTTPTAPPPRTPQSAPSPTPTPNQQQPATNLRAAPTTQQQPAPAPAPTQQQPTTTILKAAPTTQQQTSPIG